MSHKKRKVQSHSPSELGDIIVTEPASYAGGPEAIMSAMNHAIDEMGPIRALQTLAKMNKKNGFDCPGCAWPDPDDRRSVLGEYCENGAKALAEEATLKRVYPDFFEKYSVTELSTWSDFKIGKSGRLTHPMFLDENDNHYKPISWESAFDLISSELNSLDSPDEASFYTSGRSSNEAAFLYGVFVRALGTNNLPDCSNMCHESSGVALTQTLGIGKGSVTLDDMHHADVVVIMGQNPGTNHPRMLSALQKLKQNGGKVITINPLEEAGLKKFKNPQKIGDFFTGGTNITDVFLQVKINEDVALLKVIMKKLYNLELKDQNVFAQEFINLKTEGIEDLLDDLNRYAIPELIAQCGIEEKEIDKAVDLIAKNSNIIICWAMGLTQHKNGVDNIKECVNLLLLKGSIGKKGAGTCPVRGHSNVQGDRTVGIIHKTTKALHASLKKAFDIDAPMTTGLDTVHTIKAMYEGKIKVFFSLGGNFLSAASDTHYTAQALQKCDLTVSISTKLNRTHLVTGKRSLILPTLGRSERDIKNGVKRQVSVENSMGKVHKSRGSLAPASEHLMSEPEIVARIAHATLGHKSTFSWLALAEDYNLIRSKIGEVINGFEDYNQRLETDGFYLPNNARDGDFSKMPNGRAKFSICPLPAHDLQEDEFLLMSIRAHDQFNTTIYGLDDRYRGIYNGRRVLFMNKEDMEINDIDKLDVVDLVSHYNGKIRIANNFRVIPYSIPRQNVACYFPEANVIVPNNHFARESNTPISKSIKITVNKVSSVIS